MSLGVLAVDCHVGSLLTVFCLESQPGHQQTPTARSGEILMFLLFSFTCSGLIKRVYTLYTEIQLQFKFQKVRLSI